MTSVSAFVIISSISGSGNVQDYRATNDTLTFNISTTNETLFINNAPANCACTPAQSYANCICTITDSVSTPTATYIVNSTLPGQSDTKTITVDNSIGTTTTTLQSVNGNVTLFYTTTDTGFNNDAARCSGIDHIDVHWGSDLVNTITPSGTGCTQTGTAILSIASSGTKEFFVDVYDKVGNHKTTTPSNATFDVTPPQISGIALSVNGVPLQTIGANVVVLVDLSFDVAEANLSAISVDLSGLNNNPAQSYLLQKRDVPVSSCTFNDTAQKYSCMLAGQPLRVSNTIGNITITAIDASGNQGIASLAPPLTIDNVTPQASLIQTDHCDSNQKCFVKSGINGFSVTLTKNNFNAKQVWFLINNQRYQAWNCTGGMCMTDRAYFMCTSGNTYQLSLAPESRDDSGNPIAPISSTVYCDNDKPVFVNDSWLSSYQPNANLLVVGNDLTVVATITDTVSDEINATAYFDTIKNSTETGVCVKTVMNTFNCTWKVNAITAGKANTAVVQFNFTDTAGNMLTKTIKKLVLTTEDNATPSSLGLNFDPNSIVPQSINRIALDLAMRNGLDFFAHASYTITARKPSVKPQVLYQSINPSQCIIVGSDGYSDTNQVFSSIVIADPYAQIGTVNRIDYTFNTALDATYINKITNDFKIVCNISAVVKEGNTVYTNPQILQIEVPFTLRNAALPNPGQEIADKIKAQQNNFFVKDLAFLSTLDKLAGTLQTLCQFHSLLDAGKFLGNSIAVAGNIVSGVGIPIGQGMTGTGMSIFINFEKISQCFYNPIDTPVNSYTQYEKLQQPTDLNAQKSGLFSSSNQGIMLSPNVSMCGSLIKKACELASCSVAGEMQKRQVMYTLEDAFDFSNTSKGITRNLNLSNPRNSIVAALQQQCWPAVIYNVNKWRQTECNYLYCLKTTSLRGTDISTCDKVKSTQTCMIVVGEVMDLPMLPIKYLRNLADNIREVANNIGPLAANTLASKTICSDYNFDNFGNSPVYLNAAQGKGQLPPTWKIYACQIPIQIANVIDGARRSTQAQYFRYQALPDMCKEADCINPNNPNNAACTIQQSEWDQLSNNFNIPPSNYAQLDYKNMAAANSKYNRLNTLWNKYSLSPQFTGLQFTESEVNEFRQLLNLPDGDVIPPATDTNFKNRVKNELSVLQQEQLDAAQGVRTQINNKDSQSSTPINPYGLQMLYTQNIQRVDYLNSAINDLVNNAEKANPGNNDFTKNYVTAPTSFMQYLMDNDICSTKEECTNKWQNLIYKDGAVNINKAGLKQLQTQLNERKSYYQSEADRYTQIADAEQFGQVASVVFTALYAKGVFNFMTTDHWGMQWFDSAIKYLDTEQWKQSICNPDVIGVSGGTSSDESAISCQLGACQPVLTYAAERIKMERANTTQANSTYYIYTIVYYIGPIIFDRETDTLSYTVEFRGDHVVAKGYTRNKPVLHYGEVQQVQKAFANVNKFNKICIIFDEEYPPKTIGAKKEYCRDIRENSFNTGNPAVDAGVVPQNPALSPIGVDQYHVQTRTGANNEPGVLE